MKQNSSGKKTVEFSSTRFGPLKVTEDKIIRFVKIIPGFEGLRDFVLIEHDSNGVFKWLQSLDEPSTAFLLTFPSLFRAGYTVPLRSHYLEDLFAETTEEITVLVMVAASKLKGSVSLNLKAPILFNPLKMRAMPCIIDRDEYECRFMVELAAATLKSAVR